MTTITTRGDLDTLVCDQQAVLFTFFDWSGQAHISLRVFEDLEREWHASHPDAPVRFYRLDPDLYQDAESWLAKWCRPDDGVEGGFGSVTWLRHGQSLRFVRYAAEAGKETLSKLTDDFFGSTTKT